MSDAIDVMEVLRKARFVISASCDVSLLLREISLDDATRYLNRYDKACAFVADLLSQQVDMPAQAKPELQGGAMDLRDELECAQERSQMLDDLCTANARALFRVLHLGADDDEVEYEHSHDITQEAIARMATESAQAAPEGMKHTKRKPPLPTSELGAQDFCFCNNDVSLQMISGGGSPHGYLGKIVLKIDGKYIDYFRAPTPAKEA